MTKVIRAELIRLVRRRTLLVACGGAVAFAVVSTLAVFSSASASALRTARGAPSLAALTGEGGATESFAVGASFFGFFIFVVFIALIAGEFSGGTFRAMVLREPHRLRVIVGKLVGIFLVAAGVLAVAELCTVVMSLVMAPSNDIATSEWFTGASLVAGGRDYLTVLAGVAGWAVFGTTLGVVFRSVPLALGVGFAWAGPFENIVSGSWSTGLRVFPGQVLRSVIQGGTADLGFGRALLTTVGYAGVAAATTLVLISRRDVTA
jgi:ABC-type transport system involved in multi-copper enzyme maturation permease subunit